MVPMNVNLSPQVRPLGTLTTLILMSCFPFADIESPEGIAIDSISRRLYWTDSVKDTIEVASLDDPSLRAVIINKQLVNPRGIAVDPYRE